MSLQDLATLVNRVLSGKHFYCGLTSFSEGEDGFIKKTKDKLIAHLFNHLMKTDAPYDEIIDLCKMKVNVDTTSHFKNISIVYTDDGINNNGDRIHDIKKSSITKDFLTQHTLFDVLHNILLNVATNLELTFNIDQFVIDHYPNTATLYVLDPMTSFIKRNNGISIDDSDDSDDSDE